MESHFLFITCSIALYTHTDIYIFIRILAFANITKVYKLQPFSNSLII